MTGSFNFTKAAEEKNAENLLVIHDKALAVNTGEIGRRTGGIRRSMLGDKESATLPCATLDIGVAKGEITLRNSKPQISCKNERLEYLRAL